MMPPIKINYALKPYLNVNGQDYDLEPALRLLNGIRKEGNLRAAASACRYSYRKAWNLLKQLEILFGSSLVDMRRGSGSQLSPLGEKLLTISVQNQQLFQDELVAAAEQANTVLHALLSQSVPLRIIASDSEKLNQLLQQQRPIELQIGGSGQALAAYAEGKCELAGFHMAASTNNREPFASYCHFLQQKNDRFIVLEQRQQGLISQAKRPVRSFQQIVAEQLVFVNRQSGSGTRNLLDRLLTQHDIKPEQLPGYYHEEHTHLAVASMIASHQADVGLGIQNVAKRLNLHFAPITHEYYFLVFKSVQTQRVLKLLGEPQTTQPMDYKDFLQFLGRPSQWHTPELYTR